MRKSLNWSQKEDAIILKNFELIKSKKWKIISLILKQKGFQKKQTECRQRYINHLAPNLDKSAAISDQQLRILYEKYDNLGPKWTLIQQFLPQKSQVQLKNVFYGNIRCFIKKVIKYFTSKTAVFVNKFDTFTLQNIYSGNKAYSGFSCIKQDIKQMNYRFNQQKCMCLIKERQSKYKQLLQVFLNQQEVKKSKNYASLAKNIHYGQPQYKQKVQYKNVEQSQKIEQHQQIEENIVQQALNKFKKLNNQNQISGNQNIFINYQNFEGRNIQFSKEQEVQQIPKIPSFYNNPLLIQETNLMFQAGSYLSEMNNRNRINEYSFVMSPYYGYTPFFF